MCYSNLKKRGKIIINKVYKKPMQIYFSVHEFVQDFLVLEDSNLPALCSRSYRYFKIVEAWYFVE